MEEIHHKGETILRLGVCLTLSLALYYGGEKLCTAQEIPLWERHRPWLEENRVQAIATLTALLFGISLVALPSKKEEDCPPEDFIPYEDYQPCEE